MKKTYTFLLNCGYAEDADLAYLPFTSRLKFATAKEALVDLAEFFREHYVQHNTPKLKKCCEANRAKDPSAGFCAKCGQRFGKDDFDAEGYMQFVADMARANVDSFHGDFIDYDDTLRWQSEGVEEALADGSIRIIYVAEKVLAAAIGHSPDDRVTIDSIFKARTKASAKSFSFWG